MRVLQMRRIRLIFTGLVILAELLHLTWEATHGGVASHHLLNRADLPAISNWWGALLLPLLAWFLFGHVIRRERLRSGVIGHGFGHGFALHKDVVVGFVGALLYGIALAVAFRQGAETITTSLFLGMFVAALLLPVYRVEALLGFVLGMTFTFGAVLPLIVGTLVATLSAILHFLLRFLVRQVSRFSKQPQFRGNS